MKWLNRHSSGGRMTEGTANRINQYLEDTIAAERNFESALASFGNSGEQPRVKALLASFSKKARTQHERLTSLLQRRGGSPSTAKTALAHMLAFTPLSAQIGHGAGEKDTQHLMVTYAAAAAEMAMYESLAAAGRQVNDSEVVSLATTLRTEERQDHEQVWSVLRESASASFRSEVAKGKNPQDILRGYLEDAIAAEKSFEDQLLGFAKGENDPTARLMFEHHAAETKTQYEKLTERLKALGGSTSTFKSVLAHVFNASPSIAQIGYDAAERLTQHLMMAYAVENAEVAMYEALSEVARIAGEVQTADLALTIQKQEHETANKVWNQLSRTSQRAVKAAGQA
jgi:ferritin-like metal-binding protein YciE